MAEEEQKKSETAEASTKGETPMESGSVESEMNGEMNLEQIDQLLESEDPEFASAMSSIKADNIIGSAADDSFDSEYRVEDEIKAWKQADGARAKLVKVLPFLPVVVFRIHKIQTTFRVFIFGFKDNAIHFLKNLGPTLLKKTKSGIQSFKHGVSDFGASFKAFSKWQKAAAALLFVMIGVTGFVIFRIVSHRGLLPAQEEMFVTQLDKWAGSSKTYSPEVDMESFYDSMRGVQNVLALTKMVVNLRRSTNSGDNPMGAFEFVVEGAASEAVVEVKDREPEMRDLFQRIIEEMTFDQVSTPDGKQVMCDRIRKSLNAVLTKGKIRRVFIKTVILKP